MGKKRNSYKILLGKSEGNRDIGKRIILRWILEIQNKVLWTGLIWFKIGKSVGLL
jgi:hypothetical protein